MADKIVVPLDGSPLSDRVLSQLRRILRRRDAAVELIEVLPTQAVEVERVPGQLVEAARRHLEGAAAPLREAGVTVETRVLIGDPAERILAHSHECAASLMVMATHGRSGIPRWTRGSVAERVLRGSTVPVLLANPFVLESTEELRFRRILVPLDGSEEAAAVLPLARELARLYEAQVVLHFATPIGVAVNGMPAIFTTKDDALELLKAFVPRLEGVTVELSTGQGDPADTILDAVERKHCDLVAMTTRGRSGLSRWIMGSVAENVVRHARCPLLLKRV